MHLHATSMFVLDRILSIDTLRCLEINNDVGGPPIPWLVPYLKQVQAAGRSLLIRGSFSGDELRLLMDNLAPEGLFLYIMANDRQEVEKLRPLVGL